MTKHLAGKATKEKTCWAEALQEEEGKEKRSLWETAALSNGETDNIASLFGNLSMLLVQPDALLRFQPAQVCYSRFFTILNYSLRLTGGLSVDHVRGDEGDESGVHCLGRELWCGGKYSPS